MKSARSVAKESMVHHLVALVEIPQDYTELLLGSPGHLGLAGMTPHNIDSGAVGVGCKADSFGVLLLPRFS